MITEARAKETMQSMGVLKFFPSDPYARAEVTELLTRMVETEQQLDWLLRVMIDQVGDWQGPKELRGVYCTRFKPLDGIEAWSSIVGFRGEDSEAAQRDPKLLDAKGRPTLALPSAAEMKMLPLPAEEIDANEHLISQIVTTCERVTDKDNGTQVIPQPTAEDRAYSRRLLGHLYGIHDEEAAGA